LTQGTALAAGVGLGAGLARRFWQEGMRAVIAALRAVAQGLAREFGPRGIHVAHIIIGGVIRGEQALAKFPDCVRAKGGDGLLAIDAIADSCFVLHRQPLCAWTREPDLRPFREPF